jgi:DNA-directed RNA polymerase
LISRHGRRIENVVRKAIGTGAMQPVLDAGNALQDVYCVINEPVLDLVERLGVGNSLDISRAQALAARGRFTVPKNFDFRGRIYDVTHFGYQREDFIRGLFLLERGEPIGEDGTLMLMSHVAACADGNNRDGVTKPGKLNLKQRLSWVEGNREWVRAIGNGALTDLPLAVRNLPSDTPVEFVAACVELVQAWDIGPGFITRLPLTFDASCSGLQHIAAMTRSEEGWMANLLPSEDAHDFYAMVAEDVWFAHRPPMMQGHDDRKLTKGPCVQYLYGSRVGGFGTNKWTGRTEPHAMTKAVCEQLSERDLPWTGARELAAAIYEAIESRISCARDVRNYLESLARLYVKHGKEFRWTTPLGFPVLNVYLEPETKNVYLRVNGRRRTLKTAVDDTEIVRGSKAVRAASPNFVHSVDACHLQMVVLAAQAKGIEMLAIHDCFGCIAPRAKRLNEIIRDQFIELHRQPLLANLLDQAGRDLPKSEKLPELPKMGGLDLEQVRYSFHAFK